MKLPILQLATICSLTFTLNVSATIRYVNVNGTNPVSPYTSWATAATNIQDAINRSQTADTILVTNGIYQSGGTSFNGSNRVYITVANMTVKSVNGPAVTTIRGYQVPVTTNGPGAIRCAYLAAGSTLSGFTLTGGATTTSELGGGVKCQTVSGCVVTNCIITGNAAYGGGGGAYSGTVVNSILSNNSAGFPNGLGWGGGASLSTLVNCLLTGNFTTYIGGGAYNSILINCTVVSNSAASGAAGASYSYATNSIVYYNSPDNGVGSWGSTFASCCTIPLPIFGVGNITNTPQFVNVPAGDFHLQPWSLCINAGNNAFMTSSTDLDGSPRIFAGTVDMGAYENNYTGTVHFVRWQSTNAINPYGSWSTAATNIQDAVDAAQSGEFIIVGDGTYLNGGTVNRVALTNDITLLSLNGPQATTITGLSLARCAYVGSNAVLSGFTLTRGSAPDGGGVWCESGGVVSNCLVTLGTAANGGGIYGGTIYNSILMQNHAGYGGGACLATLNNCTLALNSGGNQGGGTFSCTLHNCIIYYNTAPDGKNHDGVGLNFCCTTPLPVSGRGNITNNPVFLNQNGNFHLQTNSPCINSGNNAYVNSSADLDGNPRIVGGTVDMGAYEFQSPGSILSYAYLQQYDLPADGSVDYVDTDNDGMNNWQEWHAGTVPTNALSLLKMTTATNDGPGITVTWQSVSDRTYLLQRSANLTLQPAFSILQTNIPGQAGTTSYLDTDATGDGPYFYRVGVP